MGFDDESENGHESNFTMSEKICSYVNGFLPEIDSVEELFELGDFKTFKSPQTFWLNVVLEGDRFVWKSSGKPVNQTILRINNSTCSSTCCNVFFDANKVAKQLPLATSVGCETFVKTRLLCIKPIASDMERTLDQSNTKINRLTQDNESLKSEIESLKTSRTTLIVLLSLVILAVILIGVGAGLIFKKLKRVMP